MDKISVRIGKIFIVFSLILLLFGVSLSIDSTKNTYLNNSNRPTVTDIEEIPSTNVDNTNTGEINKPITNDNNSGNNNNSNNTGSGTSNVTIPKPNNPVIENITPNNNVVVEENPEVTFNRTVNSLRNSIQDTYNITILYGDETDGYSVGGLGTEKITDMNQVYYSLLELKQSLSLYPNDFFQEMSRNFLPLKIELIQRYTQPNLTNVNVTGITEKRSRDVIISLAIDFPLADSFHHENYHYMEHYIYNQGKSYSNWNLYNPTGFNYGEYSDDYVYRNDSLSEDSYFVNSYAQSAEYEDRASTFEFMMASHKISPLNYGKNIWLKGKVMCETIDAAFKSVNANNTEYWERFIY